MKSPRLGSNEKLAAYGAGAVLVGGLVGFWTGAPGLLAMIAAIGMLAVLLLPRMVPSPALTRSRGTLMLALGGLAGVVLVVGLLGRLRSIGFMLTNAAVPTIFYLVAIGGGVAMAWAGWREFQAPSTVGNLGHSDPDADADTPETDPRPPA